MHRSAAQTLALALAQTTTQHKTPPTVHHLTSRMQGVFSATARSHCSPFLPTCHCGDSSGVNAARPLPGCEATQSTHHGVRRVLIEVQARAARACTSSTSSPGRPAQPRARQQHNACPNTHKHQRHAPGPSDAPVLLPASPYIAPSAAPLLYLYRTHICPSLFVFYKHIPPPSRRGIYHTAVTRLQAH